MAGYNALNLGFTAGGAITAGNLVKISADNTVVQGTAAATSIVGVAYNDAASGGLVTVQADGVAKVVANGTIAAGALVIAGATGGVVTIGAGTFDQVVGTALTGGDATDVIEILLK